MVAAIQKFGEIEAWQTARELTRSIYTPSERDTFARDFGVRDQMRRAAVSYLTEEEFGRVMQLAEKCGRQIYGLVQYLKRSDRPSAEPSTFTH